MMTLRLAEVATEAVGLVPVAPAVPILFMGFLAEVWRKFGGSYAEVAAPSATSWPTEGRGEE